MKVKAVVDRLAEVQTEAKVKTLGNTLARVWAYGDAGQTRKGQGSRVVEKVDKLGETLA